ncbi:unnamed protein product [Moneuplotes crassus]|uniref:Uncharacterized protein n=1 Tax=Euplotes crassus TaxID=5936 RepID=A0AAD1XVT0_EUPCR|nr:unnamed protein product [Moneuplotes crassus]
MKFKNKVADLPENALEEDFDIVKGSYAQIQARTWYRDSHGLFDYDSKNVVKSKTIKAFQSCLLNKMADDKIFPNTELNSLEHPIENQDFSVSVVYINGKYFMQNDKGYTWRVLKSPKRYPGLKWKPEKLGKGDILKLGRYIYEVKVISSKSVNNDREESLDNTEIEGRNGEIRLSHQLNMNRGASVNTALDCMEKDEPRCSQREVPENASQQSKGEMLCRICLSEDSDNDNPMISPCKCSGTMKYIHLDCLKEWLSSKRSEKKGTYFSSYLWENVYCELCKDNFTENVTTQFGVVNILGIETPTSNNYIILEALNSEEVLRKNTKMVHIIDFKKLKKLNVGRGHDNHVRITDISISRLHCKLICMKKEIYLDDQGSKFGSLIAEQKPIDLSKLGSDGLIQVGRTLLITSVSKAKICCCKTFKTSKATFGVQYSKYMTIFPSIYQNIYEKEFPLMFRKKFEQDRSEMMSCEDLLQRKKQKIDDINYNTQDRDQQNYDFQTQGAGREGRNNNAMQTQTLILPFTENHHSSDSRNDDSRRNSRDSPDEVNSINDSEVDHRFLSDDEEENKKSRNLNEEAKNSSLNQGPTLMEKQPSIMVQNTSQNEEINENNISRSSASKKKSELDGIHEFIDELNDELKSIDQLARNNQIDNEESKSQNANSRRDHMSSQNSNIRDESLIIQKRERMNKTSNLSKIENSNSSNLAPQNISYSEARRVEEMPEIAQIDESHGSIEY